ncbi:BatA domain-containing protein [Flavimarina sp. Hel_I_48]|uniref:BatA domain-containing protein n=1 Tax=Flavimarina sp. Hel_I_48 TaxID=1392488 RepID=UPI0004DF19AC|nr:BatA domain-containing protein [Flavimarina sp. Hel_I_48]
MQFKNPDILYALFLLLIPIIVHLFQLRRFKKVPFTNVAFLEAVVKNTRKSSVIKKWLILVTRLFALTAAILAFAQPFIPNGENATRKKDTVIYLDNSFSMQAKGAKGPLLTEAIQQLVEHTSENFTVLTNDQIYKDINPVTDLNTLLSIGYASKTLETTALNLKIQNAFKDDPALSKELIVVSDFQSLETATLDSLKNIQQHWVKMEAIPAQNFYIDSLSIMRSKSDYELVVNVKQNTLTDQKVPVSLYNGEKLTAKATASFEESNSGEVHFKIPTDKQFLGRLTINDAALTYDNTFYFSITDPDPLKILSINSAPDAYLAKIFSSEEYEYTSVAEGALSYNLIADQQVVILNELEQVPQALVNMLLTFRESGGQLVLIPSTSSKSSAYNALLNAYGLATFGQRNTTKNQITSINYDHPLYKNVFERRADNFQYPSIQDGFQYGGTSAILGLQNGNAFLGNGKGIFVFSGSLNKTNSNFQESLLIVPTFEEIAKTALSLPKSFYFLGKNNSFDIKSSATGDAVYSLRKQEQVFIPLQEKKGTIVTLSTQEAIQDAGIYEILYQDSIVGHVAFNYDRKQSQPGNANINPHGTITLHDSLSNALTDLAKAASVDVLFKWFLIFALFFLFCEMLLLKFLK